VTLKYSKTSVRAAGKCKGVSLVVTIHKGKSTAAFASNPWNTTLKGIRITR